MKNIIILNKKEGETPLEALENFRAKHNAYQNVKMTYAGRLDPLVSGTLLLLAGAAVKNKEKYAKLPKEYSFEILLGFATDTHDILGKVEKTITEENFKIDEKEIKKQLKFFIGKFRQKYPLYSSKNIKQVRKGEKPPISYHMVEVKRIKLLGLRTLSGAALLNNINKRIDKVTGDFRQNEIKQIWQENLGSKRNQKFFICSFHVQCGSGMYVRRLAHDLGGRLRTPALAYRIKRTSIGKFGKMRKLNRK